MNRTKAPQSLIGLLEDLKRNGIPETEYKTYLNSYFQSKTRKLRLPYVGTFELTPLCNLDCKMCYVHLSSSQFSKNNLLPIDTWKKIMLEAHKTGMRKANFTGGECLTYPGFDELYLFLLDMGVKSGILTNGVLLNNRYIDFLKCYRPKIIQISLYGSSDDEYEAVTGHRVFHTVYENIIALRDANLPIILTITPSRHMTGSIRHFLETVEALNVPYNINSKLMTPRKNTGREKNDFSDDQYIELYRIRNEINQKNCTEVDPTELPDESETNYSVYRYGLKCGAGRNSFVILHEGSMCPCIGLDEIKTKPLKKGFFSAWRELVQMVDQFAIPEECEDCIYREECLTCPALHKDAPVGHCDKSICERTKRLISAGLLPVPKRKGDSI